MSGPHRACQVPRIPGEASPLLCVVHDDDEVRGMLVGDLRERFGAQYDVDGHADADSARQALERHAGEGRRVAAVFSADTDGVRRRGVPRRASATCTRTRGACCWWGAASGARPIRRSRRCGRGQAESYIFVPWGLRERWLYLPVSELLADWEASQRPDDRGRAGDRARSGSRGRTRCATSSRAHRAAVRVLPAGAPPRLAGSSNERASTGSAAAGARVSHRRGARRPVVRAIVASARVRDRAGDQRCDLAIVGGGSGRARRGRLRRLRGTRHRRRSTTSCPAARPGPARGSATTSASRPACPGAI